METNKTIQTFKETRKNPTKTIQILNKHIINQTTCKEVKELKNRI